MYGKCTAFELNSRARSLRNILYPHCLDQRLIPFNEVFHNQIKVSNSRMQKR